MHIFIYAYVCPSPQAGSFSARLSVQIYAAHLINAPLMMTGRTTVIMIAGRSKNGAYYLPTNMP